VVLAASLEGAARILFFHNARQVGVIEGAKGAARIEPRALGQGRVRIVPVGVLAGGDGAAAKVLGEPVELDVRPPAPLPDPPPAPQQLARGVHVALGDGQRIVVEKFRPDWLTACGVKKGQPFAVEACFSVPDDDTYQFQMKTNLAVEVQVNGRRLELPRNDGWRFIPITLGKGTHRLTVKGVGDAEARLDLRFGGPGAYNVVNTFKHSPSPGERFLDKPPASTPATKPAATSRAK
jgi:hypothetical protein